MHWHYMEKSQCDDEVLNAGETLWLVSKHLEECQRPGHFCRTWVIGHYLAMGFFLVSILVPLGKMYVAFPQMSILSW